MTFDPFASLPLVTEDLAGIGGRIKQEPEDFEVEEIPAYEPSGSGAHVYLWIEKRAMGAEYFSRQVARRLGIANNEVGTAGLKDRQAVTRQWVSVPDVASDRLANLEGEGIHVLRVTRHPNKLKPGHLRGNRFRILVRGPHPEAGARLPALLERIRQLGVPNYYGPQRFGRNGETLKLGLGMLHGERGPRSPFLRRLALSAAQSALFNHILACRLRDQLFRTVLPGDVMSKWPVGGLFLATDVATEQARFDTRETVHTGPMFGRKIYAAGNITAEREISALSAAGLSASAFSGFGKLLQGTRRHNLFYPEDLHAEDDSAGVRFCFTLPSGSYATILLHELMKCANVDEEEPAS